MGDILTALMCASALVATFVLVALALLTPYFVYRIYKIETGILKAVLRLEVMARHSITHTKPEYGAFPTEPE